MRVVRCQECEVPISLYCRKCPNCCARNPAFRRRSPMAMFVLVLLMALAVFVIKNLKSDGGAAVPPDATQNPLQEHPTPSGATRQAAFTAPKR